MITKISKMTLLLISKTRQSIITLTVDVCHEIFKKKKQKKIKEARGEVITILK